MSDKRKRCERCGTDLTIYRKVLRASNQYYNNGLARAKVRDLSGAVIALRKSLDFNKKNINARNLLGLIYYEMGETVAALSEWVISRHFQPTDNDADEYINKVQSNPTRLDALNQAIKMFGGKVIKEEK
jgi:tetratricopeptide (TPR) repeat protein